MYSLEFSELTPSLIFRVLTSNVKIVNINRNHLHYYSEVEDGDYLLPVITGGAETKQGVGIALA